MQQTLALLERFRSLKLSEVVNFDKFNLIAITHHSTHLEGSTLTAIETQLLLDEGTTPKGKPLTDSLMVKDHYEAIQHTLKEAAKKTPITSGLIREINGRVSDLTEQLCEKVATTIATANTIEQQLNLSFDFHFDLVSVHPFYDGNGRTARLMMNYIQAWFGLPLALVFSEDKADYIEALEAARKEESLAPFRQFMLSQYDKYLSLEIERFEQSQQTGGKGKGFSFVF